MTTFAPRSPDFPIAAPHAPNVQNSEMGDGYVQRIESGLNNDLPALNLTWTNLTDTEATYINDFFKTRKGSVKFEYQPPHVNWSAQANFICQTWSVERTSGNTYTASATLQQVPL